MRKTLLTASLLLGLCGATSPLAANTLEVKDTYTVQEGDNLSALAKRFLGDSGQWRKIWELNKEALPKPSLIRPGMRLQIIKRVKSGSLPAVPGKLTYQRDEPVNRLARLDPRVREEIRSGNVREFLDARRWLSDAQLARAARVVQSSQTRPLTEVYADNVSRGLLGFRDFDLFAAAPKDSSHSLEGLNELRWVGRASLVSARDGKGKFKVERLEHSASPVYVMPALPSGALPLTTAPAISQVAGRLVRVYYENINGFFAVIDRGHQDEVQLGNVFQYFKKDHLGSGEQAMYEYPTEAAGTLLVVKVLDDYSVVKVLSARRTPAFDDRVEIIPR